MTLKTYADANKGMHVVQQSAPKIWEVLIILLGYMSISGRHRDNANHNPK